MMFGPNISNHYHAFGFNNANNQGRFLAIDANQGFSIATGAYRDWNGKGGGGSFVNDPTTAIWCNMITSRAVDQNTSATMRPKSVDLFPCIKF